VSATGIVSGDGLLSGKSDQGGGHGPLRTFEAVTLGWLTRQFGTEVEWGQVRDVSTIGVAWAAHHPGYAYGGQCGGVGVEE